MTSTQTERLFRLVDGVTGWAVDITAAESRVDAWRIFRDRYQRIGRHCRIEEVADCMDAARCV